MRLDPRRDSCQPGCGKFSEIGKIGNVLLLKYNQAQLGVDDPISLAKVKRKLSDVR